MTFINRLDEIVNAFIAKLPRKRPCAARLSEACLIAHRGAHDEQSGIIENTEKAFDRALALDCWGIELDVQLTADQVLVVHHDPTLLRLWGKNQAIKDLSFKQLRANVPDIPTLDEIINRYGKRLHLFIELKVPITIESSLLTSLKPLTAGIDYHVLSLDESLFDNLSKLPKNALLLVAEHMNVKTFCKLSVAKQYGGVLGHYLLLTNKKITSVRQAHQHIGVGFIDSEYSLYRELNRGITWLFTNKAEAVSHCLKK